MKIQHFAHFDSTTTLKALHCRTHCTDLSGIHESTQFVSALPLTEVLRYNTVTWSKHTMFDFYPGLPHILSQSMMRFTVSEDLYGGVSLGQSSCAWEYSQYLY